MGVETDKQTCLEEERQQYQGVSMRQKEHHNVKSFEDEYKEIIELSGLKWNDYYLS